MQHNFLVKFNEKVWAEKKYRLIVRKRRKQPEKRNDFRSKIMQIGAEKKHGFYPRKWILSERKIGVHNGAIAEQNHTTDLWSITGAYSRST